MRSGNRAGTRRSTHERSRECIDIIERAVREAAVAPTFAAALEVGYTAFGQSACTEGAREGITAFKEKRPPDFSTTK